jgi:hypothetical protein
MANCHDDFGDFLSELNLRDGQEQKLTQSRDALRARITEHFKSKKLAVPRFAWQGSYALGTQNRPISEDFDLDDGVYLQHYADDENPTTADVFKLIEEAVDGHTTEPLGKKDACVRVHYKATKEGTPAHHVDLAIYREKTSGEKLYAHRIKGWSDSDQSGFIEWFRKAIKNREQLRSVGRYLKAWSDEQRNGTKMPSGFHLTVLAVECFSASNERDDDSLTKTAKNIHREFKAAYVDKSRDPFYRPVAPNEDIFADFGFDRINNFLTKLNTLAQEGQKALDASEHRRACEIWQKQFGSRFKVPPQKNADGAKSWDNVHIIGTSGKAG